MAAALTDSKDADTYGWDTACALTFAHANTVLVAGWPQVDPKAKTLTQASSDDPNYHIDATLAAWQLVTGGDGKNVRLSVPIATGTYTTPAKVYKFDGLNVAAIIEIGMEWVPDPSQFAFVISGNPEIDTIKADLGTSVVDTPLRTEFKNRNKTLSDAAKVDSIPVAGKEWIIVDGTASYYIFLQVDKFNAEFLNVYQFGDAWKVNLQALKEAVTKGEPAVVLITIINNPTSGIAADILPDVLTTWFNVNIANFNAVFAALDLSPVVAKQTSYTWMLPTATSYAVVDNDSDPNKSIFGVLTMVQNNIEPASHQVSPYAIPAGADAGFLISGPNFMKNMLLAGARLIFNNAPAESFDITNDGLTIMNNARILFGKFHMDDTPKATILDNGYSAQLDNTQLPQGLVNDLLNSAIIVSGDKVSVTDKGSQWLLSTGSEESTEYIVNKKDGNLEFYLATSMYIEAKNFQMSLNHTWVQIQFIDVTYPYNADYDTHVTYTESLPLGLKDGTTNKVFWFGQAFARSLVTEVTQKHSAVTREIVEDIVMGALALVAIAGPIVEGLRAGTAIGEISEDAGIATIEEEDWVIVQRENPQAAAEDEAAAGEAAASSSRGRWGNIKNAFKQPRWKFVGWLAALAGGVRGVDQIVDVILKNAASEAWDKVPGFDDFAQTAIAPYTWPSIPGFTLNSAALAGSLQIGMTIKPGNQAQAPRRGSR